MTAQQITRARVARAEVIDSKLRSHGLECFKQRRQVKQNHVDSSPAQSFERGELRHRFDAVSGVRKRLLDQPGVGRIVLDKQ